MKEWKMEPENLQVTPAHLAALIQSVEQGMISQKNAKQVFAQILKEDVEPEVYMMQKRSSMVLLSTCSSHPPSGGVASSAL